MFVKIPLAESVLYTCLFDIAYKKLSINQRAYSNQKVAVFETYLANSDFSVANRISLKNESQLVQLKIAKLNGLQSRIMFWDKKSQACGLMIAPILVENQVTRGYYCFLESEPSRIIYSDAHADWQEVAAFGAIFHFFEPTGNVTLQRVLF
jgi:hypothetical protein